jgi:hypothetical protein
MIYSQWGKSRYDSPMMGLVCAADYEYLSNQGVQSSHDVQPHANTTISPHHHHILPPQQQVPQSA